MLRHARTTPRYRKRVQLILSRYQGYGQQETAKRTGISRPQVVYWERRFRVQRVSGLEDRKRSGRPQLHRHVNRATVIERSPLSVLYSALNDQADSQWDTAEKLTPLSSGPRKVYWRAGSVSVGLPQLQTALEALLESDFGRCRALIKWLHIFDATGLQMPKQRGSMISLRYNKDQVASAFESAKTFVDRFSSPWPPERVAWIEALVDWNKLTIPRPPKLMPRKIRSRIDAQIPGDAKRFEFRAVTYVLPLEAHPRAVRKYGGRPEQESPGLKGHL